MTVAAALTARNADHVARDFVPGLRMMPALKTVVIGCVDPRVDPADVLGAAPGEIAVIRNVGGRVTPEVLRQLVLLRDVSRSAGGDLGAGWELIVLHHTDCGITRLEHLTEYLGEDADPAVVADPRASVARDVAALGTMTGLGDGVVVSGLVYDVATGAVAEVAGG